MWPAGGVGAKGGEDTAILGTFGGVGAKGGEDTAILGTFGGVGAKGGEDTGILGTFGGVGAKGGGDTGILGTFGAGGARGGSVSARTCPDHRTPGQLPTQRRLIDGTGALRCQALNAPKADTKSGGNLVGGPPASDQRHRGRSGADRTGSQCSQAGLAEGGCCGVREVRSWLPRGPESGQGEHLKEVSARRAGEKLTHPLAEPGCASTHAKNVVEAGGLGGAGVYDAMFAGVSLDVCERRLQVPVVLDRRDRGLTERHGSPERHPERQCQPAGEETSLGASANSEDVQVGIGSPKREQAAVPPNGGHPAGERPPRDRI